MQDIGSHYGCTHNGCKQHLGNNVVSTASTGHITVSELATFNGPRGDVSCAGLAPKRCDVRKIVLCLFQYVML